MSRLVCLLLIMLVSCNSNQIKEIEVLSYYDQARNYEIYSSIDVNGFAQVLSKNELSNRIDNYQTTIRKSLMDSILNECQTITDESFHFKPSKKIWYCGLNHTVRITYKDGNKYDFQYLYPYEGNKQFIPFQLLFMQIRSDSLNASRLNSGQQGKLFLKQNNLSLFSTTQDSIKNLKYLK
ncbi:hypothetical protein M0M57_07605 [Flavobacterium azooxidireducens]|uniref:DUF4136 domain-containing protein n=1 Tax=Flavobacterium azooxidireducens TaxID=1871076 RepID=A0ABY4KK67_9FLAO|nr:hypothetical protein [Flavobacterium azooxidireducens]UPQ80696.1 hypothetical protein M0M57_07605 [Flavobacterium azooxidireducens]